MKFNQAVYLMRKHQKGFQQTPKSYKILRRHHQQQAQHYESMVDGHLKKITNPKQKSI